MEREDKTSCEDTRVKGSMSLWVRLGVGGNMLDIGTHVCLFSSSCPPGFIH